MFKYLSIRAGVYADVFKYFRYEFVSKSACRIDTCSVYAASIGSQGSSMEHRISLGRLAYVFNIEGLPAAASFLTRLLRTSGLSLALMAASAVFATSASANSYSLGAIPNPTVTLPAPGLLPSRQTFFALSGPPISTKKVFAHYMVCCGFKGPAGSIAADEEEIIMAQTMGINGFALNLGAWSSNSTYQAAVANMFQAAAALNSGFVLFFSADMTGLSAADVVSMMTVYANNPYYFKYNGQPVLSTFSGQSNTNSTYTTPSAWWTNLVFNPLKARGINSSSCLVF